MFFVYLCACVTTLLYAAGVFGWQDTSVGFTFAIAMTLWLTVLFANFAEALAEGQGKTQAAALRQSRRDVTVYGIASPEEKDKKEKVWSSMLHIGDLVLVEAGQHIPADGVVVEGAARKKTPSEISLEIFLTVLTAICID